MEHYKRIREPDLHRCQINKRASSAATSRNSKATVLAPQDKRWQTQRSELQPWPNVQTCRRVSKKYPGVSPLTGELEMCDQKPLWDPSFWKTPSSGNQEVHNRWREYFDQPRTYTLSGDLKHGGAGLKYSIDNNAHGTLSMTTNALSKSPDKNQPSRPRTAPTRNNKRSQTAWNPSHHIANNAGFYRNRLHTRYGTMPTASGDLRSTMTWELTPGEALTNVLANWHESRSGAPRSR